MAITLKTGGVGEGKSASTIALCIEHLRRGGVVATNFGLADNWSEGLARWKITDILDPDWKQKRAHDLWSRWFRIGTVETINDLSKQLPDLVNGEKGREVKAYRKTGRKGRPESLGLLVLDEGHIFFNSRDWKNNMPMIHFCSQSRKKGWDVVIIAHDADMIDSQIRKGLINFEETTRNLAKARMLPLLPFTFSLLTGGRPIFLGVKKYSGKGAASGAVHSFRMVTLSKEVGQTYDTMEEFNFADVPAELQRIGPAPALPEAGSNPPRRLPEIQPFLDSLKSLAGG